MMRNMILRLLGVDVPAPLTGVNDLNPYSASWDRFVSDAIDAGDVQSQSQHHALVGGIKVWVENYPYSFGHPIDGPKVLPSLDTRARLREAAVVAFIRASKQGAA